MAELNRGHVGRCMHRIHFDKLDALVQLGGDGNHLRIAFGAQRFSAPPTRCPVGFAPESASPSSVAWRRVLSLTDQPPITTRPWFDRVNRGRPQSECRHRGTFRLPQDGAADGSSGSIVDRRMPIDARSAMMGVPPMAYTSLMALVAAMHNSRVIDDGQGRSRWCNQGLLVVELVNRRRRFRSTSNCGRFSPAYC
jgi:hypothetical protein